MVILATVFPPVNKNLEENMSETNIHYIQGKLPHANERQLALISSFIKGLGICVETPSNDREGCAE